MLDFLQRTIREGVHFDEQRQREGSGLLSECCLEGDIELFEALAVVVPVRPGVEAVISELRAHVELVGAIRGRPRTSAAAAGAARHGGEVDGTKVNLLLTNRSRLESVLKL